MVCTAVIFVHKPKNLNPKPACCHRVTTTDSLCTCRPVGAVRIFFGLSCRAFRVEAEVFAVVFPIDLMNGLGLGGFGVFCLVACTLSRDFYVCSQAAVFQCVHVCAFANMCPGCSCVV